jgi:DNA-binding XRE family transcriptional regulator
MPKIAHFSPVGTIGPNYRPIGPILRLFGPWYCTRRPDLARWKPSRPVWLRPWQAAPIIRFGLDRPADGLSADPCRVIKENPTGSTLAEPLEALVMSDQPVAESTAEPSIEPAELPTAPPAEPPAGLSSDPPAAPPPLRPGQRRPRPRLTGGTALLYPHVNWSAEAALMLATTRAKLGLTQWDLAHIIDCRQSLIARFESADRTPPPALLSKLCQALGLTWYQPAVILVPGRVASSLLAGQHANTVAAGPKKPHPTDTAEHTPTNHTGPTGPTGPTAEPQPHTDTSTVEHPPHTDTTPIPTAEVVNMPAVTASTLR